MQALKDGCYDQCKEKYNPQLGEYRQPEQAREC